MISHLFGNYGIRNSVHNGQTQKTLQVADLLDHLNGTSVIRVDSTNLATFSFRYVQAVRAKEHVGLCLGRKGLAYVAGLDALLSPVIGKTGGTTVIFAVGGWLREAARRNGLIKRLCQKSKVLVETPGLSAELAEIGISAELFPNFRDMPVVQADHKPPGREGLRLVFCGRISADKGWQEAVALADRLIEIGQMAHLQFYGPVLDNDFLAAIENREYVSYGGTYDDPRTALGLISRHHFMVLPSRYAGECVPGAIIEAKFAGVPAIVSDWRFLPEVVSDGRSGFVCTLPGFVQEAVDKLVSMSRETYREMSLTCRKEAQTLYSTAAAKANLRALTANN